jgi:hypothetical protein
MLQFCKFKFNVHSIFLSRASKDSTAARDRAALLTCGGARFPAQRPPHFEILRP